MGPVPSPLLVSLISPVRRPIHAVFSSRTRSVSVSTGLGSIGSPLDRCIALRNCLRDIEPGRITLMPEHVPSPPNPSCLLKGGLKVVFRSILGRYTLAGRRYQNLPKVLGHSSLLLSLCYT